MSDNEIKISIIVPCYKVEKYLPRCLDSLVNQTLPDIEIICINDGSPDNCINILKEYREKYGEKIVIIDKQNEGVWRGRKDGIKKAQGEFIGFVDSDDYVALDFAEKLYTAAKKNDADIAVCGFDRIDLDTGNLYSREMTKFPVKTFNIQENPGLLLEVNTALWNKVYKSALLKDLYELKNIPVVLEDMSFLQLLYFKSNKIVFLNESLVFYTVRGDSAINSVVYNQIPTIFAAMNEIRSVYEKNNPAMLNYLDSCVFLHLCIALMHKVHRNKNAEFNRIFNETFLFVNNNFPNWKSKYMTIGFIVENRGANKKLFIGKKLYDFHLFKLFLKTYSFVIDRLGIDVKW